MKNWLESKAALMNAPLPEKEGRYCPIPHSVFLQELQEMLFKKNMIIRDERYLTCSDNKVMTGWFSLKSEDKELAPSITFVNSYNKTKKASIRASALVLVCKNGMMGTVDNGYYSRKHLGDNALQELRQHMEVVIDGVEQEFQRLLINKEEMQSLSLTPQEKALLIGDMYLNESIITPNQLSIIKKELTTSQNFKGDTAWALYNHVTEALKDNHPMNYEGQHIKVHTYMADKLGLTGARGLYGKTIFNNPEDSII